jgi:precorrin-3B C17-methyltransferase
MRSKRSVERQGRGADRPQDQVGQLHAGGGTGSLAVVSLGPGSRPFLAPHALRALESAEAVFGYKTYLELISDLLEGKEVFASGMRKEVERCRAAIDAALSGRKVALVSSGDAGIYGMAGLVFDLCRERGLRVAPPPGGESGCDFVIEVIPGVAAVNAAAALLGSPLMHDFAVVSLSDHLTPWDVIEKRLHAAASADFVVALYNPRSHSRPDLLEKARRILLRFRTEETPAGVVRRAMREGQWVSLTTLGKLPVEEVDMQSIVIVGNSQTYIWNGWMVTPRGYLQKYGATAPGGEGGEG